MYYSTQDLHQTDWYSRLDDLGQELLLDLGYSYSAAADLARRFSYKLLDAAEVNDMYGCPLCQS